MPEAATADTVGGEDLVLQRDQASKVRRAGQPDIHSGRRVVCERCFHLGPISALHPPSQGLSGPLQGPELGLTTVCSLQEV